MLAAERYDGARAGQPRHGRRDLDPRAGRDRSPTLTGFEGRIVWDTSMPNGQPRRQLDATPRAASSSGSAARRRRCATASSARSPGTARTRRACASPERRRGSCAARAGGAPRRLRGVLDRVARSLGDTRVAVLQCSRSLAFALDRRAQRLGLVPGRRPDLATDDRLAARRTAARRRRRSATAGRSSLAPVAARHRPDASSHGVPVIVLLQVLVLGAARALRVYGSPTRIGGARSAAVARVWVVRPFAVIPLFAIATTSADRAVPAAARSG